MSEDPGRDRWQARSEDWAARAVPGRSRDDTFNQMIIAEAGIRPGESVLHAWNPYRAGGILWVPNYARLGIGWKTG